MLSVWFHFTVILTLFLLRCFFSGVTSTQWDEQKRQLEEVSAKLSALQEKLTAAEVRCISISDKNYNSVGR